jgi:hypothetical protein
VGLAGVIVQAGCAGEQQKPKVASLSGGGSSTAGQSANAGANKERPRHRVDESDADRERLIQPWNKCMKDNGADPDTQPNNIAGAEQWGRDHARAGDACRSLLPELPWGEDKANPQYRDNIHQWVKCMNDKGLKVIETPDNDESPWRYADDATVADKDKIELDCEKATIGKFDK